MADKTQTSLERADRTLDSSERKSRNVLQTARSIELNVNRAINLFETNLMIAEKMGLKIDKDLRDNINNMQLILRDLSTATTMAAKLTKSLGAAGAAAAGLASAGVVAGAVGVAEMPESAYKRAVAGAGAGVSIGAGIVDFFAGLFGFKKPSEWAAEEEQKRREEYKETA